MASLLYKNCLCLATVGKVDPIYVIQACINMSTVKIEEVDNGRGIQPCRASHEIAIDRPFQVCNATVLLSHGSLYSSATISSTRSS